MHAGIPSGTCTSTTGRCTWHLGIATENPCGNSIVDAGENCDDGNRLSGDDCSPICQLYATYTPSLTATATYTLTPEPTKTMTPTPSDTPTPSVTSTPTMTPTRTPVRDSLVLRRALLRAATSAVQHNAAIEIKAVVNLTGATDALLADVDAGGLRVTLAGAGGVEQLLSWRAEDCVIRGTQLACRSRAQSAVLRPTRGGGASYELTIRASRLTFAPPLAVEPISVALSTATVDRTDTIGDAVPCLLRGGRAQILLCVE